MVTRKDAAKRSSGQVENGRDAGVRKTVITMPDHTIRIARLKMLFVAVKILSHGNRDEMLYSIHEQRSAGLMDFLGHLDHRRREAA